MAKYKVYKHMVSGYEAIKNGISWPGFFFIWAWAFLKKLWIHGLLLLVAGSLISFFGFLLAQRGDDSSVITGLVLLLLPNIITGILGNFWLRKSMLQKGYVLVATAKAKSPDDALSKL